VIFLLWIGLILHLSSQTYKEQSIQPWLSIHFTQEQLAAKLPDWTIHYLGSEVAAKKRPFTFIEFFFRKGAHIFIYSLLALFSYLLFTAIIHKTVWRMAAALFVVVLVGGLDEWNQSFTNARTGVVQDIGIDLLGASLLLLFVILIQKKRRRQ
jgi:VanZ family protein